jgi:hypothetical protein
MERLKFFKGVVLDGNFGAATLRFVDVPPCGRVD